MLLTPPKQKFIVIEPVKSGLSFKISFNFITIFFITSSDFDFNNLIITPFFNFCQVSSFLPFSISNVILDDRHHKGGYIYPFPF